MPRTQKFREVMSAEPTLENSPLEPEPFPEPAHMTDRVEPGPSPSLAPPPASRLFRVSVPHCPSVVVEADSFEGAVVRYFETMGILSTEHTPTVTEQERADDS